MYKGGEEENDEGEGKGGDKAELVSCVGSHFLSCSLFKAGASLVSLPSFSPSERRISAGDRGKMKAKGT